jgi:hypothetical protein
MVVNFIVGGPLKNHKHNISYLTYIQRGCYDDDGMVVEHVSFYIICNLCLLQLKMVSKHVIPIIDKVYTSGMKLSLICDCLLEIVDLLELIFS